MDQQLIQCVIEGGYNTSYINALLTSLFYKDNINIMSLLNSDPVNTSAFYLQELIKTSYIEPLRRHFSIKSDIFNEIRNYLIINGFQPDANIFDQMKQLTPNKLYAFLINYFNGNKLEFNIMKTQESNIIKTEHLKLN
jgi:hypothetical protein